MMIADAGGATTATMTATTASDAKSPSHFCAPTNVPRYDRDTNPSVRLEDYRLALDAGGTTDNLFVINVDG
jgi:hypothetical protein